MSADLLFVPDERTARLLGSAAKRMGIELRPLPTLEEWRAMWGIASTENHDPGDEDRR